MDRAGSACWADLGIAPVGANHYRFTASNDTSTTGPGLACPKSPKRTTLTEQQEGRRLALHLLQLFIDRRSHANQLLQELQRNLSMSMRFVAGISQATFSTALLVQNSSSSLKREATASICITPACPDRKPYLGSTWQLEKVDQSHWHGVEPCSGPSGKASCDPLCSSCRLSHEWLPALPGPSGMKIFARTTSCVPRTEVPRRNPNCRNRIKLKLTPGPKWVRA